MNYRHAYHAGSFADVFKHALLTLLLAQLKRKDKPFCMIDTHAGIGWYDLHGEEARKTGEADGGIRAVIARPDWPDALLPYRQAVRAANLGPVGVRRYPGSPALALALMRPRDRLIAVELHRDDFGTLKGALGADPRVALHCRDGYEAVRGLLPPPIRRGLVLIDPPFERADEAVRAARAVAEAATRWPTGQIALWYPIKAIGARRRLVGELQSLGVREGLVVELEVLPPRDDNRLTGTGMLLIRPPYGLADAAGPALGWLRHALDRGGAGARLLPLDAA